MNQSFDTPVLIIIFNRPAKVKLLIEALSHVRPSHLYISADGPRKNVADDEVKSAESKMIAQNIDWPCEIKTNFSKENQGCRLGVSSAITWFFDNVEEGIILEDDCIPDPSFFTFSEQLLRLYRNDEKVMHICGSSFSHSEKHNSYSYRFSRFSQIWGWATWRRAWNKYDINMSNINSLGDSNKVTSRFLKKKHLQSWIKLFKYVKEKNIDTWDSQWQYSLLTNDGYSICPTQNMITNIGFDAEATHTKSSRNNFSTKHGETSVNLTHPPYLEIDLNADAEAFEKIFKIHPVKAILSKLKSILLNR